MKTLNLNLYFLNFTRFCRSQGLLATSAQYSTLLFNVKIEQQYRVDSTYVTYT